MKMRQRRRRARGHIHQWEDLSLLATPWATSYRCALCGSFRTLIDPFHPVLRLNSLGPR